MKHLYLNYIFLGLLFLISWKSGQTQDFYLNLSSSKTKAAVIDYTDDMLKMHFSIEGLSGYQQNDKKGNVFTELHFGNGYHIGEIGTPKLPAFKKLIQVPLGAKVEVHVKYSSEQEYDLSKHGFQGELFPVQPSVRKDIDTDKLPFEYSKKTYTEEGYTDIPVARLEVLGIMRGIQIARVEVAPVSYDPVNRKIRVRNDIEVEIIFSGVDKKRNHEIINTNYSHYFEPIYGVLANPIHRNVYNNNPDLTKYPVRMLIVSNRMFEQTLQPYIQWKTKKGYKVEVAYTDIIGTSSSAIQSYIHAVYNGSTTENPAPTFLVLVGDVEQLPASATGSSSGKRTDLYYASVDGDYFPDMYYGRLSAQSTAQLENIINKILYYEQYQFSNPEYLNNVTLIAGTDATWNPRVGQPTVKYGTANYFNSSNGFNTVWGYGVSSDPNNPNNSSTYTGCYDNERFSVSFINFTAHCSSTSWAGPNLSISNVYSMLNTNKYPLAIGNCCQSADFGTIECIGEAWIRAQSKGAVTYIGSSPNSYWFEDFYWSVGAFPIVGNNNGYVPSFQETTLGAYDGPFVSDYVTAGGLVFLGNLAVTEVNIQGYPSHSSPLYYWQAYNVLGDPSVVHYLTEGSTNTVNHQDIIPIGLDTYAVNALPGSYVAISKDGILHGSALVGSSGEVDVSVEPILNEGNVDIVVTRPQTQPYITQIPAAAIEGPYIVLDNFTINDYDGNNNGQADFGESFTINVTLKNIGATNAYGVTASLLGNDSYFSLLSQDPSTFGIIQSGDVNNITTVIDAFSFELSNVAPNQHQATFLMIITDGSTTWQSSLRLTANAPVFNIESVTIDDGDQGIPNMLDPGEMAQMLVNVSNIGNADAASFEVSLVSNSTYISVIDGQNQAIESLLVGDTQQLGFSIFANINTPLETTITFTLNFQYEDLLLSQNFEIIVGQITEYNISNTSITTCLARFYDSGGSNGNYSNNENFTLTVLPTLQSSKVKVEFQSFNLESNYDFLKIYDGLSTTANLLANLTGTNLPGSFVASNPDGALTFRFTSDASIIRSGWQAMLTCENNLSDEAYITSFDFQGEIATSVTVSEVENGMATINVVLASGTNLSSLVPVIEVSEGATINPVPQQADFTNPVEYFVTSESGSVTNLYTVNVTLPVLYVLSLEQNIQNAATLIGAGLYEEGQDVTIDAFVNPEFLFLNWSNFNNETVSDIQSFTFIMPPTNTSFLAIFERFGDVNNDGVVNVLDITKYIGFIVNYNTDNFNQTLADVNGDGVIDIVDVVSVINLLLYDSFIPESQKDSFSSPAFISAVGNSIILESDGTITALQLEVILDSDEIVELTLVDGKYTFSYSQYGDLLRIIIVSLENKTLPSGEVSILKSNSVLVGCKWGRVMAANSNAQSVMLTPLFTSGKHYFSSERLRIYPNPFEDRLTIESIDLLQSLKIVDLTGREIISKWPNSYLFVENLTNLSNGSYVIHIKTERGIYRNVLIKK